MPINDSSPWKVVVTDQTVITAQFGHDLAAIGAQIGRDPILAIATAEPATERVVQGELIEKSFAEQASYEGSRPALAIWQEELYGAFIGAEKGRLAPFLRLPDGALKSFGRSQSCSQVSLTATSKILYFAWCEQEGPLGRCHLIAFDRDLDIIIDRSWVGWSCTLASNGEIAITSWCDPSGVFSATIRDTQIAPPHRLGTGPLCDASAAAISETGRVAVSWHAPISDGILNWPRVAIGDHQNWSRVDPPITQDALQSDRSAATEDQGWEFPAMAWDRENRLWLAGRSSQGYRLQAHVADTWSTRLDLASQVWGGRGRGCCIIRTADAIGLVRSTPKGVQVDQLDCVAVPCASTKQTPNEIDTVAIGQPVSFGEAWPTSWPRPLFGDPHQHTIHSDGLGGTESAYRRARALYRHDFVAVTDHESFTKKSLGPLTWKNQCDIADAFYLPGEFVTLYAYEFTGKRLPGPGHKCVYFGASRPDRLPAKSSDALRRLLIEHNAIAVPHHIGWTGADVAHHDMRLQPVWEICSVHGSYETAGAQTLAPRPDVILEGQFIHDALLSGLRFGFVGGSDSHGLKWHHGVSLKPDPWRCGLTAAFAERTRDGLLQALRTRHCYATSGAPILMHLDVEGATMGSAIRADAVEIFVEVHGTAPISELALIQDGQPTILPAGGSVARYRGTVRRNAARASSFVYVRARQNDGDVAWSSPIWLDT